MLLREFFRQVNADPDMQGAAIRAEEPYAVVVLHPASGFKTKILFDDIEAAHWEDLRGVILNLRPPIAVIQIARIVGYYSQVRNWNASKTGELKDRHKGNYKIGETP